MDKLNDQQILSRGQDAEMVLNSEAFKLALKTLRDDTIRQWKDCPIRDKEGQLLLLQLSKVTDKFEGVLLGLLEQGKMIQHKINLDSARDEPQIRKFFRTISQG